MTCHDIKRLFPDYLIGDIDNQSRTAVQSHLADCEDCRAELESLSEMWTRLGVLPEERPSEALRGRFYGMLDGYKREMEKQSERKRRGLSFSAWLESWWPRRPAFQFGLTLFVLTAGIIAGMIMRGGMPVGGSDQPLLREVRDLRVTMASSLLGHPSAAERIRGINVSADLREPDGDLLRRLLETLDGDPSVNVRLAAVDALYLFRDSPVVKTGLAESLGRQRSPLVQVALIDLMVNIRERRAVDALRSLLKNRDLHQEVKKKAEEGLADLM